MKMIMAVALAFTIAACGSATKSTTSETSAPAITTKAAPIVAIAPTVISLPIPFAEQKNGITVIATDVGQIIVDGVDHERGIIDRGNWRIVAQCDRMTDKQLMVGVIKDAEFTAISQAGKGSPIADNTLSSLLTCP